MKYSLLLIILLLLISCIRTNNKIIESSEQSLENNKTIKLTKDFKILCKLNEEFASDSCYDSLVILKGENTVYKATDRDLFVITGSSKPLFFSVGQSDLILIQFDNRPDLNRTLAIYFQNGILNKLDTIPQLDIKPKDIDNDNFIEFIGTMHLTDSYCQDCDSAFYNPSLVYKYTEAGLKLDSINTIAINKKQWGDFYGYKKQNKILHYKNLINNKI